MRTSERPVTRLFWTLLGVMLTGAALLPTIVEARLSSNHNETLLRDTRATQ